MTSFCQSVVPVVEEERGDVGHRLRWGQLYRGHEVDVSLGLNPRHHDEVTRVDRVVQVRDMAKGSHAG